MVRALRQRVGSTHRRRRAPVARQPYPIFIAYSDVAAARHAIGRLNRWLEAQPKPCELLPMLWHFRQLDQARWREMALREATRARTLALAMGANATLSAGTEAWLTALTAQHRGAVISALVLLGDDAWTISLQHTGAQRDARNAPTRVATTAFPEVEVSSTLAETICAA
jgi:hypothetical protein